MGGGRLLALVGLLAAAAASSFGSRAASGPIGDFTFKGEPIHPKLVEEFEVWLSDDRPPITTSVDVAAAFGTNEYSEAVKSTDDGLVRYESADGWYGYQHLGQTSDGTHVLRTSSSGGGWGVFTNLLFVRLDSDEAHTPDGSRHERLLMSVAGRFVLGDRDDGTVEVLGDRVVVGASKYRAFPTTLDFGR
jgi:hypothetical protein